MKSQTLISNIIPKDFYFIKNGLKLHYLDWGNYQKQSMLLLHGFLSHAHVWDDFAKILSINYHIIALDQRGHGESDWSKEKAYAIEDHFFDITCFIESLNLKDLILIGHSMGGRNALFYTACRPERVKKLIVIDARPSSNFNTSLALKTLIKNLPLNARNFDYIVERISKIFPFIPPDTCQEIAKFGFKRNPDGTYSSRCDSALIYQSKGARFGVDNLWPFIKNISSPTLIIRGEKSTFLSRRDAKRMCEIMANAELKEVSKASHMPAQENLDEFLKVIMDFLG